MVPMAPRAHHGTTPTPRPLLGRWSTKWLWSSSSSSPSIFLWCNLLLTGSHHSPSVSTIPLYPFKSRAPIHELILHMSVQCTNPGPPYPCQVCLRSFRKSQYSFKCSGCLSWVHQRCSELRISFTMTCDDVGGKVSW